MLRLLRIAMGLSLLAGAGWTLLPHLVSIVGTSGVVNAPLLTVRSPLDGTVTTSSPGMGAPIREGEQIVVVQASRTARDALEEAVVRARGLANEREALLAQIHAIDAQIDDLKRRADLHRELASAWLVQREAAVSARASTVATHLEILQTRQERARALEGAVVSASARVELELEVSALQSEFRGALAEAAAVRVERQAIEQGVALDLGAGEGLYARQTLDSRAFQRIELMAGLVRVESDLEAARMRIDQARETQRRQDQFAPSAPVSGAVWEHSPAIGTAVMTGDVIAQILDCRNRFLDVTVSERNFGRLEVGSIAAVRLRGSNEWREARVASLMGAGALIREGDVAARARNIGSGELRVILSYADDDTEPSRFCDVGRSVDVRFDAPNLLGEAWAWLTRKAAVTRVATDNAPHRGEMQPSYGL